MEFDIERLKRRDRGAWASVYEQLADAVFAHALYRVGCDHALAEDVTADVFLRAIESIDTYQGGSEGLLKWMRGIARRVIAQRGRSLKPIAARTVSLDDHDPTDPTPAADEALIDQETQLLIGATLTALPPQWEQALGWKYRDGLSVNEIANRLAVSPKAAESLLGRARAAFRDMYRKISESDGRLHEIEEWSHD